jgi:hypothetical protein
MVWAASHHKIISPGCWTESRKSGGQITPLVQLPRSGRCHDISSSDHLLMLTCLKGAAQMSGHLLQNSSSSPQTRLNNFQAMSSKTAKPVSRIAIVGSGQVGGSAAHALILGHVADELLLVDNNIELRDGQVRDLTDVAYCHHSRTRVHAASYYEAGQCDIVIIAARCRYTTGKGPRERRETGHADGSPQAKPRSKTCHGTFPLSGASSAP